jgi:hypothetical protein
LYDDDNEGKNNNKYNAIKEQSEVYCSPAGAGLVSKGDSSRLFWCTPDELVPIPTPAWLMGKGDGEDTHLILCDNENENDDDELSTINY